VQKYNSISTTQYNSKSFTTVKLQQYVEHYRELVMFSATLYSQLETLETVD